MPIATPNFVTGDLTRVRSGSFDFPASSWEMTIKGNTKTMSNMRDGIMRVTGLEDAEGTFKLKYDQANDPTVVANGNIRAGSVLDLKLCLNEAVESPFYGVKAIVDEITPAAEFGDDEGGTFNVKWMMQSGTIAYPVYGA